MSPPLTRYLPTTPYRGTRDFLPDEMSVRDQTFRTLYDTIERYGYRKYDGPILESAEIYEAKSGREIADLQLYTLTDRGGRQLALRPEMTPSVARMIAANANTLQFPVRWYSHPNCHRYERPQRGRVREHWQINVDIFGSDSWRAEVEIFELIHDMLASVGATRDMYVLRASDRVLLEGILRTIIGVPDQLIRPVSALIDRWEKVDRDQLAEDAGHLGLSEDQFTRLETVLKSGPDVLADLPADVLDRSHLINILRSEAGDLVTFDPLIVRAFEYYTSTVFEVFDNHPDNNRSIFGGGRYSDLVGLFSPNKIPGIGFGFGDVTLFNFLDTHELTPKPRAEVDVVVLPIDESLLDAARHVAGQLRAAGYRASSPFEARKLGKELTRAGKIGARLAVVVGPDEWSAGTVSIRDLDVRSQETVSREHLVRHVGSVLKEGPHAASQGIDARRRGSDQQ